MQCMPLPINTNNLPSLSQQDEYKKGFGFIYQPTKFLKI